MYYTITTSFSQKLIANKLYTRFYFFRHIFSLGHLYIEMLNADALKKLVQVQEFERIKDGLRKYFSVTKANQKPSSVWSSRGRTLSYFCLLKYQYILSYF